MGQVIYLTGRRQRHVFNLQRHLRNGLADLDLLLQRNVVGNRHYLISGKQLAFDGDELSCGAKLISSFKHYRTG